MGGTCQRFAPRRKGVGSSGSIGDAALGEVIGRQLHSHLIAGQDSNIVFAHLSGNMRDHYMAIFQFHSEHGVGQGFDDAALYFDMVFFRHGYLFYCSFVIQSIGAMSDG